MTIRTYRAKTAGEALAQVKKELGRTAVILHTRTYQTGGFLGFRKKRLTEITATTQEHGASKIALRRRPVADPPPRLKVAAEPKPAVTATAQGNPVLYPPPGPLGSHSPRPHQLPTDGDPLANATHATPMREVAKMIVDATERPKIEQEMTAIKRMVGQVLQSTRGQSGASMPEPLFECYMKLMESEVAGEIADKIVGQVRDELAPDELEDSQVVRMAVLRRVASFIPVSDEAMKVGRAEDGRSTTIALIGPTGVGKTTTVAKLAATYKLRHGKRVGLITCDTYRIAAVDQLRTYANIIGIDLKVVLTPREMATACDALSNCDVILIDTAGRAPRDAGRLCELRGFLDAAKPHQTHLVLSSAASESCLHEAASQFTPLGCDRVLFTKLDEAVNFGVLVNVASRLSTRLSFVTTGQEVPDHIEAGNSDRLARFVLGQEVL